MLEDFENKGSVKWFLLVNLYDSTTIGRPR